MRHYQELVQNLKKHGIIKSPMDELERRHIYKFLLNFSSRLDLLEDFISEETDYDGKKVYMIQHHGKEKENWLKDDNKKRKRNSKSDKEVKK